MYKLTNFLSTGFVLSNLNEPRLGQAKERIPLYLAIGFSAMPINQAEISIDVVKDQNFDFDYRFGIQYYLQHWLTFMTGFQDGVNNFTTGFSLIKSGLNLGYAFIYHPNLGGSNTISIGYEF